MSFTRRSFLSALGAAAAVPFVARLLPKLARAADNPPPRRLVVVYTGQGHHIDQFLPQGAATIGTALEPLAPYQSKLLVLHNILGRSGHYEGHAECLTGRPNGETFTAAGGPSVDQILADRNRKLTVLPSLELGCYSGNGADGMIAYSAAGLPIPAATDPRGVFDRMFRTLNQDPAVAARRRKQDKSVLDAIAADFTDLQAPLSPAARRILDAHLTVVREQEQALAQPVEVHACDLGASPGAPTDEHGYDYPTAARLQMDNVVAALACDVTRVATVMLGYAQNTVVHKWLGHTDDFHQIAHGAVQDSLGKFLAIDRWQAGEVAHLVGRLDALGLLDSTAVVWITELGLHRFDHLKDNAGVVIAGSAGGFLRTGRTVDMGGADYDDVLITLLHAMGATDITHFGATGTGPLAILS
ncbi:MAG: DUF1552 domain-containing protein [Myxococcota bacterium]